MSATAVAVPGTVIPTGALVSPGGGGGIGGPQGIQGLTGTSGTNGLNSFNLTTTAFTVPAVNATATVTLADASWAEVGAYVYVAASDGSGGAAAFLITAINGNTLTLQNPASPGTMPLASPSNSGLLAALSGNVTDYVGGDNACHALGPLYKYLGSDTTNATNYAVTVSSDFALVAGAVVWVIPTLSCATNPYLNVNGTGSKQIVSRGNVALGASEIVASKMFGVMYDGTNWRVITPLIRYIQWSNSGNVNLDCAGFDEVSIQQTWSINQGAGMTLLHLANGTRVTAWFMNNYTAGNTWWLNWTTVTGGTGNVTAWAWSNSLTAAATVTRIDSTNTQTMSASATLLMTGALLAGQLYLL